MRIAGREVGGDGKCRSRGGEEDKHEGRGGKRKDVWIRVDGVEG